MCGKEGSDWSQTGLNHKVTEDAEIMISLRSLF